MKTIFCPCATFVIGMALFVTCMSGLAPGAAGAAAPAQPMLCAQAEPCADETI